MAIYMNVLVGLVAALGAGAVIYWVFFYEVEDELE